MKENSPFKQIGKGREASVFACLMALIAMLGSINTTMASDNPTLLKGVWKLVETRDLDTGHVEPGENFHYMISERYIMALGGKDDRPIVEKNFAQMTPDEILSQLPAGGGFMEYKIVDGRIHRVTVFALSEFFEGKTIITEFEVDAETLIFRDNHHADGHLREWVMRRIE